MINSSNSYQQQYSEHLKKLGVFFIILLSTPLIAGLYGIVHDQITYSISEEYYTKFKFFQFKLAYLGNEAIFPNPRIKVMQVGFMATWWTGLIIGLLQGLVGFIHKDFKTMFKLVFKSVFIVVLITMFTGIVGFFYGKFFLTDPDWYFPENLLDKQSFINVGSIHNFGYLGGLLGLFAGIIFQFSQRKSK
ncbi:MAG: hypothetical protein ABIP51_07500 [Bacteroidia bacterium]